MFKKNTGELEEQLRKVHPSDIREYQKANQEDLVTDKEGFLLYMNDKLKVPTFRFVTAISCLQKKR